MLKNNPKILTREAVESAPELTMDDVATDEEKVLIDARKVLSDAVVHTENDAGAAIELEVIKAAKLIYEHSPAEWVRIRQALKDKGARLSEIDKALRKVILESAGPDGHFKMLHLWPGQNAPPQATVGR